MNARQYARAQQRPLGPLRKLIRAILHALGVPVTPYQVNEIAIRLYRPTLAARDVNYAAALAYLRTLEAPPTRLAPRPRDYPVAALTSTIRRVVSDLRIDGEPITEANRSDTRVIELARKAIEGPVARQAMEPARETIAAIGEDEEQPGYGWARILVGAYSCSFCAMLASRGPVYTSKAAALGRGGSPLSLYHTPHPNKNGKLVGGFCDCIAVPVPRVGRWEGQAAHQKLEKLWQDTTEGQRMDAARSAFRREWDKQVDTGETGQYLAESLRPKAAA